MIRLIIDIMIGGCIGVFAMCLCIAADKVDENGGLVSSAQFQLQKIGGCGDYFWERKTV